MSPDPTFSASQTKVHYLRICDMPPEVLVPIFRGLRGQDIALCMGVCRCFADLVRSEDGLQYKIELARNGMVDGNSSTLFPSERLQRLRQYSSNFRNGIFDHETFPRVDDADINADGSLTSVLTYGSAQAGIKSRHWITPLWTPGGPRRFMCNWAIDRAQDLLAVIEEVETMTNGQTSRFLEVRFRSLSRSETIRMDHPAAMVPRVQVFPPPDSDMSWHLVVFTFIVWESHIIWQLCAVKGGVGHFLVEVLNWRTGQMVSRIDYGTQQVEVVPWGYAHILVTPADAVPPQYIHLYSLSTPTPNRPLLTLQLPKIDLNPGETLHGVTMKTSLHPSAPGGHFRADPEQSMLLLTHQVLPEDSHPDNMDIRNSSHLLIPYATLRAQLDAVTTVDSDSADLGESSVPPAPIPWQDWGSRTSLRLRVRPERELGADLDDLVTSVPLGSRLPLVVLDGPSSASVYVFDIDPLAARYARGMSQGDGSESTAIVEDVEVALPGVVDPECAAIPFVVYRFALPPSNSWIREVHMSLTGFAVKYYDPESTQMESWTV